MGIHRISEQTEKRVREYLMGKMKNEGYIRSYTFNDAVSQMLDDIEADKLGPLEY